MLGDVTFRHVSHVSLSITDGDEMTRAKIKNVARSATCTLEAFWSVTLLTRRPNHHHVSRRFYSAALPPHDRHRATAPTSPALLYLRYVTTCDPCLMAVFTTSPHSGPDQVKEEE